MRTAEDLLAEQIGKLIIQLCMKDAEIERLNAAAKGLQDQLSMLNPVNANARPDSGQKREQPINGLQQKEKGN